MIVGPAPFFRMATIPVPPTCSVTSYPALRKRAANSAAVCSLMSGEFGMFVQIKVESMGIRINARRLLWKCGVCARQWRDGEQTEKTEGNCEY